MSRCRVDLVNKAFAKMDVTGDEVITAEDLKRSYDVTQHPKFKTGEWSRERILKEFLDTFQLGEKDDIVSWLFFAVGIIIWTRTVLPQGNRTKPCKFRYVKPLGNYITNSNQRRRRAFSTTVRSFDTTSPANLDEYRHKPYIARNHQLWSTSLLLTLNAHLHLF